jgi:hypothetical protein
MIHSAEGTAPEKNLRLLSLTELDTSILYYNKEELVTLLYFPDPNPKIDQSYLPSFLHQHPSRVFAFQHPRDVPEPQRRAAFLAAINHKLRGQPARPDREPHA